MSAAMELRLHMQKKRDAAQMSAAAVSFYLDKEAHNKLLRVSTNQELQATNEKLTTLLQEKDDECDHWHTESISHERKLEAVMETLETVEESLGGSRRGARSLEEVKCLARWKMGGCMSRKVCSGGARRESNTEGTASQFA